MSQLTGVLALILSESPIIPLNISRYTTVLKEMITNFRMLDPKDLGIKI